MAIPNDSMLAYADDGLMYGDEKYSLSGKFDTDFETKEILPDWFYPKRIITSLRVA